MNRAKSGVTCRRGLAGFTFSIKNFANSAAGKKRTTSSILALRELVPLVVVARVRVKKSRQKGQKAMDSLFSI